MPAKKQEMQILNVRLTPEIIEWIDSLVEKRIYPSRSEAVRDFIRDYLRQTDDKVHDFCEDSKLACR
jgi:Arc/MetJ-type ribon-helix-helix transcriptional regulator